MSAAESVRPRARRSVWPSPRSRPRTDRAFDDRTPLSESEFFVRSPLLRLLLIENRRDQVLRHLLKMRRLHRVTRPSFRKRTNRGGIAEELCQRNFSVNDSQVSTRLDAVHLSPTPV